MRATARWRNRINNRQASANTVAKVMRIVRSFSSVTRRSVAVNAATVTNAVTPITERAIATFAFIPRSSFENFEFKIAVEMSATTPMGWTTMIGERLNDTI